MGKKQSKTMESILISTLYNERPAIMLMRQRGKTELDYEGDLK